MDIIFAVGICHPSVGVADSSPQREPKSLSLRRDVRSDGVVAILINERNRNENKNDIYMQ
jgi:hypothetical protein